MSYYYENEAAAQERRIDYDLSANVEFNIGSEGFDLNDVAYVLAAVMGENDGPSYYWLCAMKDHTYAYVKGSCDYTGWDCQSSGSFELLPTLKMAIAKFPEKDEEWHGSRKIMESIKRQLVGECAFGETLQA